MFVEVKAENVVRRLKRRIEKLGIGYCSFFKSQPSRQRGKLDSRYLYAIRKGRKRLIKAPLAVLAQVYGVLKPNEVCGPLFTQCSVGVNPSKHKV